MFLFLLYGQMFTDYAPPYKVTATWKNYFSLISDSEKLRKSCDLLTYDELKYSSDFDYKQLVRTLAANLQFVGLNYVAKAINLYAKELDVEYDFLVNKLMGYVSKKITVISKSEIQNLLHNTTNFKLPDFSHYELDSSDPYLELYYTVELFKALASWNNDVDAFRLLVPLLSNPQIMTLIIKHLTDIEPIKGLGKIYCNGTSCVLRDSQYFNTHIQRTVDRKNLRSELETIYCKSFHKLKYKKWAFDDDANKLIDLQNEDDDYFKVNQLIALITGMPDLFIRTRNANDLKELLQTSLNREWDYSTNAYLKKLTPKLMWEEYVTAELVPSSIYLKDKYKVIFDINMGEYDRINFYVGKIKASVTISIANSFLKWVYRERKNENTINRLAREIEYKLTAKKEFFKKAPWNNDIAPVIARELLSQMDYIPLTDTKNSEVVIEFRYAPFALNYIQKYSLDSLVVN